MIPTINVSSAASTSTMTTDASTSANTMGIVSVSKSGVLPETDLVKVSIVIGREYLANKFENRICFPRFVEQDACLGGLAVETCTLTENGNHKHELKMQRKYQPTDSPIPSGAVRLFESVVYIDSLEQLPDDYCSVEQTRSTFIQTDDPQCLTRLDEEDKIAETCLARVSLHVHTKKELVSMPLSASSIPQGALNFYQDFSYVFDKAQPSRFFFSHKMADPCNEPLFSRRYVSNKLLVEGSSFYDWQIPHGWDALPRSIRERYLSDIVDCYKKGATICALSQRHGLNAKNINGLLLLKLTRREMKRLSYQRKLNLREAQDKPSPFADAREFSQTLGEVLGERIRYQKNLTATRRRRTVKKEKKLDIGAVLKRGLPSAKKTLVVFSPPMQEVSKSLVPMESTSSSVMASSSFGRIPARDGTSLPPPKKRLSFRSL